MHNNFLLWQEAKLRQDDILRYAARRRLVTEARAAEKAARVSGPGRIASMLCNLGSQLESAGRLLQKRYGPPPVKA